MNTPACDTCGDTRVVPYQDASKPGTIGGDGCGTKVCPECSAVVSLADAENAVVVRTALDEKLYLSYHDGSWCVAQTADQMGASGDCGFGETATVALKAYRDDKVRREQMKVCGCGHYQEEHADDATACGACDCLGYKAPEGS